MTGKLNRRRFIKMVATGLATPLIVSGCQDFSFNPRKIDSVLPLLLGNDQEASYMVFDLSIASGDPNSTGVVLWTHIAESAYKSAENLYFQVALDASFIDVIVDGQVDANDIHAGRDFTVSVDLDGQLQPNTRYYYRFVYDGVSSRTGRCRTCPVDGVQVNTFKFGVVTCQDYTNGYYGTMNYLAADETIDFVLHLGDFIYESAGDARFQNLPFADRYLQLPSDSIVAMDLEDYRHIHKVVRTDRNLQLALERHTFIVVPDDHETANDCYWDYDRDTLGAPDHPYVTQAEYGNDPALLTQLKLDSQRAWLEYTPVRVEVDETAVHPHQYSRIYRRFQFGDLIDLYMLDTRTYRSAHPCGEKDYSERYGAFNCENTLLESRTILGEEQKIWLTAGLIQSPTRWQVLGNQTFMGRLGIATPQDSAVLDLNVDAWDGYKAERQELLETLKASGRKDLVVLTGDLHTYMASELKLDFEDINPLSVDNYIGVEFMTPSVTSAGLMELVLKQTPSTQQAAVIQALSRSAVQLTNPHVRFFDSTRHGYSTIEFSRDWCEWRAYTIDKNNNTANNPKYELFRCKKYHGVPWLM